MNIKDRIISSKKGIFILLISLIILLVNIFFWQSIVNMKAKTYYREVELNTQKQEYMERVNKIIKAKQEQELNIVSNN